MKIWTDPQVLQAAAAEVGVKLHNFAKIGQAHQVTIRPLARLDDDSAYRYQRTSANGFTPQRRVFAVCWHGHRDFFRAIYRRDPNARIKTGLNGAVDYRGSDNFEDTFPETAYTRVGRGLTMDQVCLCTEEGGY